MNYYEELGLTSSASPDQIRQAYKNLARLLHPDQQAEEHMRRLAEAQMKRLNGIYGILSDPVKRREYDLTLGERAAPVREGRVARWRRWLQGAPGDVRVALGLAGLTLVAGGLYWILTADSKARPPAVAATWAPPPAVAAPLVAPEPKAANPLTKELEHLRRRALALEAERDAVRAQLARMRAGAYVASRPGPRSAVTLPEPPAVADPKPLEAVNPPGLPVGPLSAPPAAAARTGAARFAGNWFYAPARMAPAAKALYPPEYIEVSIAEEGGVLKGRYYGRYRVTDRAISPEVRFYFEGRAQQQQAVLEWQGGGGARGEVLLKLVGENSLEVTWSASELGNPPGLAAGTAVLVRRIE